MKKLKISFLSFAILMSVSVPSVSRADYESGPVEKVLLVGLGIVAFPFMLVEFGIDRIKIERNEDKIYKHLALKKEDFLKAEMKCSSDSKVLVRLDGMDPHINSVRGEHWYRFDIKMKVDNDNLNFDYPHLNDHLRNLNDFVVDFKFTDAELAELKARAKEKQISCEEVSTNVLAVKESRAIKEKSIEGSDSRVAAGAITK